MLIYGTLAVRDFQETVAFFIYTLCKVDDLLADSGLSFCKEEQAAYPSLMIRKIAKSSPNGYIERI